MNKCHKTQGYIDLNIYSKINIIYNANCFNKTKK